jgi:hypothetical protein
MRLNSPTKIVWTIAVILGIVGLVFSIVNVSFISQYSVWILAIGWLLLVLGTTLKGF